MLSASYGHDGRISNGRLTLLLAQPILDIVRFRSEECPVERLHSAGGTVMGWFLLSLQVGLALLLSIAAIQKALQSSQFSAALRLSHVPSAAVAPVAVAVPAVEALLAGALVVSTPGSLPIAFAATVLLLTMFTAWVGWVRAKRIRIRCGCFGSGSPAVDFRTITRNVLTLVASGAGLLLATWADSPLPVASPWMASAAISIGLGLALGLGLRAAVPVLVLSLDRLQRRQVPDLDADGRL
ncbi:MAG TPA: MauE/DoxX family redox-associated membrane protein [Thermomicrobiales bacterium]|jgi:hypothetical protein